MHSGTWVIPEEVYSARVNGSCLCGAVKWSYDAAFTSMLHCHCSVCRKHHGTWYATFVSGPLTSFHWRGGTEQIASWRSSDRGRRSFCTSCGAKVPGVDHDRQQVFMPAGALEGELGIRPQMHLFVQFKAPAYVIADGLPQHAEYPQEWGAHGLASPARETRAGVTSGSCACGRVRFELEGAPLLMRHCHCGRCRHARGGAHATNIAWPLDAVKYTAGESLLVDFDLPGAQFFGTTFCSACGGFLPRRSPGRGVVVVPVGALDTDPGIFPSAHQFTASKAPWHEIHDGVPQFAEAPPRGAG